MIIYIHGFGGSGQGSKASAFREYFAHLDEPYIAPSLSYIPHLAIKTLEELIESFDGDVKLIGSSLGGFYSIYLSHKYNIKAVLLNPSIYPWKTLEKCLGDAPSYYDLSTFKWSKSHIKMLELYEVKNTNDANIMLCVQKGDELLDYQKATSKFPDAKMFIDEGGNHSFEGINKHFDAICEYLFGETK